MVNSIVKHILETKLYKWSNQTPLCITFWQNSAVSHSAFWLSVVIGLKSSEDLCSLSVMLQVSHLVGIPGTTNMSGPGVEVNEVLVACVLKGHWKLTTADRKQSSSPTKNNSYLKTWYCTIYLCHQLTCKEKRWRTIKKHKGLVQQGYKHCTKTAQSLRCKEHQKKRNIRKRVH